MNPKSNLNTCLAHQTASQSSPQGSWPVAYPKVHLLSRSDASTQRDQTQGSELHHDHQVPDSSWTQDSVLSLHSGHTWRMAVLSFCSSVYLSESRCSHLPSNFDHDLLQSPWRRESHATSPRRSPLGLPLTSSFAPSVCSSRPLSAIPQTPLDYTPCAWCYM